MDDGDKTYRLSDSGRILATTLLLDAVNQGVDVFDKNALRLYVQTTGVHLPCFQEYDLHPDAILLLATFPLMGMKEQGIGSMEQLQTVVSLEEAFRL